MADSSRHSIYGIVESAYGTTPTSPSFKTIRHTGTTLGLSKTVIVSDELRADRQISDARHGVKQVGGDIATELSYGTYDDYLEAALMGTWAPKATLTATTLSAAASDKSFNDSGNGFVTAGFEVGDQITVSGFTGTVANNRSYLITSVAAGKIIVTKSDGTVASNIVDDAAGESVTIVTATTRLKAGVVRRSFSILRYFSDLLSAAKPYYLYKGVEFNKWALTVAVNAIVKQVFSVIGQDQAAPSTTEPSGATYAAATTTSPMDSFSGALKEGGATVAVVTEVQLTLDNGEAVKNVIGSALTILPSVGRSNVTANVTAYFEDGTLVGKFINETESSVETNLGDVAGNKYRLVLPRIKYNGGQPDTQGQGAITLAMPVQALLDSVTGTNIYIDKIPVAS